MLLILFLVVVCTYLLLKWSMGKSDFFEKQGIKFIKPYPLLGTNIWFLMRDNIALIVQRYYNQYPNERVIGLFDFGKPYYLIRDPDLIKQLTIKEFEKFPNHKGTVDIKHDELFGSMLSVLRDKKWREMRNTLSPIFTSSKMRMMFDLMSEVGAEMTKFIAEEYSKNGRVAYDVKDLFSRYTNDVIATCAFGLKVDSFRDQCNDFYTIGQSFVRMSSLWQLFKAFLISYCPKTAKKLQLTIFSENHKKMFYKMIIENMKTRERDNIHRPDLINLLMQVRKGELKHDRENGEENDSIAAVNEILTAQDGKESIKLNWSDTEIIAQCFLFFLAGFETSSATLRFMAYELATNPDVQERLTMEIDEVRESLDGKPLTYDSIQSIKYLDMVISETLRKWPAGFMTDRQCNTDFVYKGDDGLQFKLENKMQIWIPIYGLHMDPKYYPDPEKFDPERFSEENRKNINFNAYLPFGIGPRNCIGSRFALMEMKVAIYHILEKFTFQVCPETQVPLKLKKVPSGLTPEVAIKLNLKPILKNKVSVQ